MTKRNLFASDTDINFVSIISATTYCNNTRFGPRHGYTKYLSPVPFLEYGVPNGYTVRFSCGWDRILVGPSSATCQDDGSWSASPGHCELCKLKYLIIVILSNMCQSLTHKACADASSSY